MTTDTSVQAHSVNAPHNRVAIPALLREHALFFGMCLVVGSIFAVGIPFFPLFFENQNTYYPPGMLLANDYAYLQADWFTNTRSPHIAFTLLIAAFDKIGALGGASHVATRVLYLSFALGAGLVIGHALQRLNANGLRLPQAPKLRTLALLVTGIYLIVAVNPLGIEQLLNQFGIDRSWMFILHPRGIAEQQIINRYLQPSEFGTLIVLGVGCMGWRRWILGTMLLAIVAIFHFGYFFHSGVLVVIAAAYLWRHGQLWRGVTLCVVFGALVLPVFIYNLSFLGDPNGAEGAAILATERLPHHTLPRVFWDMRDTAYMIVMVLGGLLAAWKVGGLLRWVLPLGALYTAASIGLAIVINNDTLSLLHLWRGSTVFVPLSMMIIFSVVTALVIQAWRLLPTIPPRVWIVTRAALVILAVGILVNEIRVAIPWIQAEGARPENIIQLVQDNTEETDVIMVYLNWNLFRLVLERPIYVDRKSHPYAGTEVLEWTRRYNNTLRFYAWSDDERETLCLQDNIAYYIITVSDVTEVPERTVARSGPYLLVDCSPRDTLPAPNQLSTNQDA